MIFCMLEFEEAGCLECTNVLSCTMVVRYLTLNVLNDMETKRFRKYCFRRPEFDFRS